MTLDAFNRQLLDFLARSPTPFHATRNLLEVLADAGFTRLLEGEPWQCQPGGRYVLTRNDTSLIAFTLGDAPLRESGLRLVGAHTDSPCLRVKPQPELQRQGLVQLAVEVYGGALLNPWFDRDLSLAGRVSYEDAQGTLRSALVDFQAPVAVIPSLAIHLDRGVNDNRSVNAQLHLPPVLGRAGSEAFDFRALLLARLLADQPDCGAVRVLDFDISLYDTQPPALVGLAGEFIASARLDNLVSCFVGLQALLAAPAGKACMLVATDHEEVGSLSACGARGTFLKSVLERLCPEPEARAALIERSVLVSADNAHGIHPNYADRHEPNHGPQLNGGPVIKVNHNQSYATNSETAALFRQCCLRAGVPVQSFVTRSDLGCGSTIGPLTAAEVGVRTVDVGVPQFGMHSVRELAGRDDPHHLYRALLQFWKMPGLS